MLFSPLQNFFSFYSFLSHFSRCWEGVGMKMYGNDPAIPLLCIHPEETRTERDTCTSVFTAALYTITWTWMQPRCPSTDEWMKKLWNIYTMEYYLVIKRNTFESVLMKMNLEPIVHSEVGQKKRQILHINTYIWNLERWYQWSYMQGSKGDTDVKNRLLDSAGKGEGGMIWENSIEICILP